MAENMAPSTLPPPPSAAGAPGMTGPPGTNGATTHPLPAMPPPALPPVVIPQNNNPIPQPMSAVSPGSGGGQVRRAAPEPNKRALYIGGLDPRVTEDVLRQIFETTGHVVSVKIIPDKNSKGLNYGFVEYDDPGAADRAMNTLNGRRVHHSEIKVNWAYQSNSNNKEDTSSHFHVFVGDLSNEVNDEVLLQAFSAFGSVSEARVMWDMKTGRSRGYGFVAYRERNDAEKALANMDGEWLGSRAIRCNWANQKGQPSISQQQAMAAMGITPTTPFGHHQFPTQGTQSYEMVLNQTPSWQTTCYVGNLTPYTTQNDLVPLFQNFGNVVETRFQSDRGFAFIKMESHEVAAMAICQLSGYNVNGRPLKCSWGKDRPPTGQFDFSPNTSLASATTPGGYNPASPYFPQYNGGPPITPQSEFSHQNTKPFTDMSFPGHHNPRASWASPPSHQQMHSPYSAHPGNQPFGPIPNSTGSYSFGHAQTPNSAGGYQPQMQNYGGGPAGYQY